MTSSIDGDYTSFINTYYPFGVPQTLMKTAGQNPSAGISGTAHRTVSKGGYVGVVASKFYAGYKRRGEHVAILWDATTVRITDTTGTLIATYAEPDESRGWHGPTRITPSTKS